MDCCTVYSDEFDRGSALADAQRYRRRGLDRVSRAVMRRAVEHGVRGARVLEIGGGAGALSLELLEAGADSAVNVELSSSYRDAAHALALEAGLEDRIELVAEDGVSYATRAGRFDLVVLNRVVCCYPDATALLGAAADAAAGRLVASHPTIHFVARAVIGTENLLRARRGSQFRTYVHPSATLAEPSRRGLVALPSRTGPVWTVRSWVRPS